MSTQDNTRVAPALWPRVRLFWAFTMPMWDKFRLHSLLRRNSLTLIKPCFYDRRGQGTRVQSSWWKGKEIPKSRSLTKNEIENKPVLPAGSEEEKMRLTSFIFATVLKYVTWIIKYVGNEVCHVLRRWNTISSTPAYKTLKTHLLSCWDWSSLQGDRYSLIILRGWTQSLTKCSE